jgi:hypothetical protein
MKQREKNSQSVLVIIEVQVTRPSNVCCRPL